MEGTVKKVFEYKEDINENSSEAESELVHILENSIKHLKATINLNITLLQ